MKAKKTHGQKPKSAPRKNKGKKEPTEAERRKADQAKAQKDLQGLFVNSRMAALNGDAHDNNLRAAQSLAGFIAGYPIEEEKPEEEKE